LGADVAQVVSMFLWMFIKIFIIACVIALPLTWFLADNWLEKFVYRSPIGLDLFFGSLLGLLVITVLTVGYEIFKAARTNPVVALRSE
jgi:putative ABC transport system permease protein